jgi:steroid delta-isomerase-like uncharacterized protein
MTREQIVAQFTERQGMWRRRDPDGLAGMHAEDSTVVSPIFGTVIGRHNIRESYRNLFKGFGDWTLESTELLIDGSRVAQGFKVTATHTADLFGVEPTNRRFEIHGVVIYDLNGDGQITRERRMYDFTGMLIQMGILRAKPI